jgi:hypothetical protein
MGDRKPLDGHLAKDRREPVDAVLFIELDPRLLRGSLERVRAALNGVEPETSLRVERLVGQLVGRASELPRPGESMIQLRILVTPHLIRVQAEGPATVLPYYADAHPVPPGRVPTWVVDDLVDRWGPDRRHHGLHAVWFLLMREAPLQ